MNQKTIVLIVAAVCSLFTITNSAHAQGTAFSYQGRLNDTNGPANGIYDLRFAIYDASVAGAQQGSLLTNSALVVSNGFFSVTLDFGNQFPGADRWLEIGVRMNGGGAFTNLVPRQQLTATPYAIQAGNAAVAASASSVSAANISGTIPLTQLPAGVVTNGASGVTFTGTFTGNGAGVTNVSIGSLNSYQSISWGTFVLVSSNAVGNLPVSVVSADINGDGKADLISANMFANTLTVLTNNGRGVFGFNATINVGNSPSSVVAADVNGDGKVDLISADSGSIALTVLTNNGSGGFVLSASYPLISNPSAVTAADVNGDGKVDLISANHNDGTLTVLTNNGSGGFVLSASYAVGINPVAVTAADVNGDGKVDLISANQNANTLTVLTNNGSGSYGFNATVNVGGSPRSVTAADVNGDGKVDLISANFADSTLSVLTNNGSGGFGLATNLATGLNPLSVIAADLNRDGWLDLICANQNDNSLSVLTNNGHGGFGPASSLAVGGSPRSVVAVDVSGDGAPDLVSADATDNALAVLFNTPTFNGSFIGSGAGLTGLNASQLTSGTVPLARLPASVVTNNESGVTLAGTFSGNGSGLTNAADWTRSGSNIYYIPGAVGIGTTTPGSKMDVRGNIALGTNGQYYASGGVENLRIFRGRVAGDGTVLAGVGFSVSHTASTGVYTITFLTAFFGEPAITATARTGNSILATSPTASTTSAQIKTVNSVSGSAVDQDFFFIAIGPQ